MNKTRSLASAAVIVLGLGACLAVQATPAYAATSGDNCGTNTDWGYYNCMYIGDGIIRGWSHQTREDSLGATVHEEVTGPNGLVCNSNTLTTTSTSEVISCQVSGSPVAGNYCSTIWVYNSDGGTLEPTYYDGGQNCLTIS